MCITGRFIWISTLCTKLSIWAVCHNFTNLKYAPLIHLGFSVWVFCGFWHSWWLCPPRKCPIFLPPTLYPHYDSGVWFPCELLARFWLICVVLPSSLAQYPASLLACLLAVDSALNLLHEDYWSETKFLTFQETTAAGIECHTCALPSWEAKE